MAYFTHIKDETKPHNKIVEAVPNGIRLVDFLKNQELVNPQIFLNGDLLFSEDGEVLIDIDDNYRLKEDDNLLVVNTLKGGGILVSAVVTILASTVASYAISALLAPDKPSIPKLSDQQKGESEYSISTSQNMAKKGQPIPECFGEFVRYPDLISAPYYRYHNNEEYLYMSMCIGKGINTNNKTFDSIDTSGDFEILSGHDIFIEDTPINNYPMGDINTIVWNGREFGNASSLSYLHQIAANSFKATHLINKLTNIETSDTLLTENTWELFNLYAQGEAIRKIKVYFEVKVSQSITNNLFILDVDFQADYTDNGGVFFESVFEDVKLNENQDLYIVPVTVVVYNGEFLTNKFKDLQIRYQDSSTDIAEYVKVKSIEVALAEDSERDFYWHDLVSTSVEVEHYEITRENPIKYLKFTGDKDRSYYCEIDVLIPALYRQNGSLSDIVELEATFYGQNGYTYSHIITIEENTREPIKRSYRFQVFDGAQYVTIKKTSPDAVNAEDQDTTFIERIKSYNLNNSNGTEPWEKEVDMRGLTRLDARIKTTKSISAKSQFKMKIKAKRKNPDPFVAEIKTLNECISHIYTTENGGRQDPQNLDLPSMPESFNHVFEKRGTVYQAMNTVARSGNYNLYPSFNSITAKKDEAQPIPAFMFNESNIIKGTLKISKTVRAETDYDGMKGIYKDADTFEEKTIVFPETAIFPQELPLDGVTDDTIALERTKFAWYQGIYRNTKYEFDTTLVGHIPSLFTKCQIAHNSISNSIPNQLIGYTTNTVTLRDAIKTDGTYTHIVFRDRQGAPSSLFEILSINENVLTLDVSTQALPVADFYIGDDELKTMCQVGTSATFIKDIMLTEIKPKRGNKISIKAFNYDERVYQ